MVMISVGSSPIFRKDPTSKWRKESVIRGASERILLLRKGGKFHIFKLEPFRI